MSNVSLFNPVLIFSILSFACTVTAEPLNSRSQESLISNHINSLKDDRKGLNDFYFVGFAPYSTEDVFMNEATYVRNLFDLQYDTLNRSILLVNNLKTLELYPVAILKNLERTFNKIGTVIDPEEDIVVLYITSHGLKDQGITLKLEEESHLQLDIDNLDAKTIRRLFDENNIKWRIILILACFSGGFIDTLKNENSLIITSAREDKPSFGCGHHGNFTQFGEAYFKDELSKFRDLISSFYFARVQIEKLEKQMKLDASEPQIFIGKNIRPVLDRLMH